MIRYLVILGVLLLATPAQAIERQTVWDAKHQAYHAEAGAVVCAVTTVLSEAISDGRPLVVAGTLLASMAGIAALEACDTPGANCNPTKGGNTYDMAAKMGGCLVGTALVLYVEQKAVRYLDKRDDAAVRVHEIKHYRMSNTDVTMPEIEEVPSGND